MRLSLSLLHSAGVALPRNGVRHLVRTNFDRAPSSPNPRRVQIFSRYQGRTAARPADHGPTPVLVGGSAGVRVFRAGLRPVLTRPATHTGPSRGLSDLSRARQDTHRPDLTCGVLGGTSVVQDQEQHAQRLRATRSRRARECRVDLRHHLRRGDLPDRFPGVRGESSSSVSARSSPQRGQGQPVAARRRPRRAGVAQTATRTGQVATARVPTSVTSGPRRTGPVGSKSRQAVQVRHDGRGGHQALGTGTTHRLGEVFRQVSGDPVPAGATGDQRAHIGLRAEGQPLTRPITGQRARTVVEGRFREPKSRRLATSCTTSSTRDGQARPDQLGQVVGLQALTQERGGPHHDHDVEVRRAASLGLDHPAHLGKVSPRTQRTGQRVPERRPQQPRRLVPAHLPLVVVAVRVQGGADHAPVVGRMDLPTPSGVAAPGAVGLRSARVPPSRVDSPKRRGRERHEGSRLPLIDREAGPDGEVRPSAVGLRAAPAVLRPPRPARREGLGPRHSAHLPGLGVLLRRRGQEQRSRTVHAPAQCGRCASAHWFKSRPGDLAASGQTYGVRLVPRLTWESPASHSHPQHS